MVKVDALLQDFHPPTQLSNTDEDYSEMDEADLEDFSNWIKEINASSENVIKN